MLTPSHHDAADRMDERMYGNAICAAFEAFVQGLRKDIDALDGGKGNLNLAAQGVVESGKYLVAEAGLPTNDVGALVVRELQAAADASCDGKREYIDYWIAKIGETIAQKVEA